jgi:hypothetical protein
MKCAEYVAKLKLFPLKFCASVFKGWGSRWSELEARSYHRALTLIQTLAERTTQERF